MKISKKRLLEIEKIFDNFYEDYRLPESMENDHILLEELNNTGIRECFENNSKKQETLGVFVRAYNKIYGSNKTASEILNK